MAGALGQSPTASGHLDIAPYGRLTISDPERKSGTAATRVQEIPAEDLFLTEKIVPGTDGLVRPPEWPNGTAVIGIDWAERRDITRVGLVLASVPKPEIADLVRLEHWSGISPWQGEWLPTPAEVQVSDRAVIFSGKIEEAYRVRVIASPTAFLAGISGIQVLSPAESSETDLRLGSEGLQSGMKATAAIYNGYFIDEQGSRSAGPIDWDVGKPLDVRVAYAMVQDAPDSTLIRIQLPDIAFAVAVQDILQHGIVYVPDAGFYAMTGDSDISFAEYKDAIADQRTVLERVRQLPEHTFPEAYDRFIDPLNNNDPLALSLACANEKFAITRDGQIGIDFEDYATQQTPEPGAGLAYPGWTYPDTIITPKFGTLESLELDKRFVTHSVDAEGKSTNDLKRTIEDGWLPIPTMRVEDGGIRYSQRAFVAPISDAGPKRWPHEADVPAVCVVEFTAQNLNADNATAVIDLSAVTGIRKDWETEFEKHDVRFVDDPSGIAVMRNEKLLGILDISTESPFDAHVKGNACALSADIAPGAMATALLYLPDDAAEKQGYESFLIDPQTALERTKKYWHATVASAMGVDVPEPLVNALLRASQVHILIAARNLENGAYVSPWIGSTSYGALDTEGQVPILAMDLLGHGEFSRRALDFFLSRYNDRGMLANGYTLTGTGQNLWVLGEHYALHHDTDWFQAAAPGVKRALDWIIENRRKTQRDSADGPVPEYGLMPPGVLADWHRYAYYFYANGYFYAGLNRCAEALADIGDSAGGGYLAEAEMYRKDILRAYEWNRARMPVMPLLDGTWVPAGPSSVYTFGPTRNYFDGASAVGHDVEAGGNHVFVHGVLPPDSKSADWVINYLEDQMFFVEGYTNYSEEEMRKDWFNFGGISKIQPYYTRNAEIYGYRDDIKPYLRSYLNAIIPMLSTETMALWEHPHAAGGWNKPAETGWFIRQTRLMLVMEKDDELWLAALAPREWFQHGKSITVTDAPTYFGAVSFSISSHVYDGEIRAKIVPPTRGAVKRTAIRLRHPDGKQMSGVTIDGNVSNDFDAVRELVYLPQLSREVQVVARYN